MRAAPTKWQVVLTRGGGATPVETVISMAEPLWLNQTDRHAPVRPIEQAEAEIAVHLALSLVHIFQRPSSWRNENCRDLNQHRLRTFTPVRICVAPRAARLHLISSSASSGFRLLRAPPGGAHGA
jgi:hypothetical protein